jgi:hypothetical protein
MTLAFRGTYIGQFPASLVADLLIVVSTFFSRPLLPGGYDFTYAVTTMNSGDGFSIQQ